jgi:hypothetical protein
VGQRFFPLDEELRLLPGQYTPQVQEAITRLGSRLSFEEAREELELLWGLEISTGGVRHITLRHGRIANELIEAEVARLEREAPEPSDGAKQLVVSADGAMVQLTSGEWREVKTVAMGEFVAQWDAKARKVITKTENISYFSRVEPAESFARSALYEWQRRGGEKAEKVVTVNDGAVWIQNFVDYHCPQAVRVLDFAHAQGYLAVIGKAIYGAETEAFSQWYARMSQQLGHQPPHRTLSDLEFLQQQQQQNPHIADIKQALRYLQRRREMIDYPHFRKAHLPIGSGIVEAGHKVVMQKRMKQAGMRWHEANLNPMLALRTAICNKTWHSSWHAIQSHYYQSQPSLSQLAPSPAPDHPTLVTQADCERLTLLAKKVETLSKPKSAWKNHKWIFPHRHSTLHKN